MGTDDPVLAIRQAEARAATGAAKSRQVALLEATGGALYMDDPARARELANRTISLDADTEAAAFARETLEHLDRIQGAGRRLPGGAR